VTYYQRQRERTKKAELARIEARREALLAALAGPDRAERERLDQLSTAHLIALTHVNPTLFDLTQSGTVDAVEVQPPEGESQ
jgi:hypothetical protein